MKIAHKIVARRPRAAAVPLRFAHPFFTTTPPAKRKAVPGVGKQLVDHIQENLFPNPAPRVSPPNWKLGDIIGAQASKEFLASGSICFHSVGDTGKGMESAQGDVAEVMATDFDVNKPQTASPAFFFHLGDVIYGPGKNNAYRPEFYEPYVHYPGKIIAIAGNHDGETFPNTDTRSLEAFKANFVTAAPAVPAIAGTIFRETMNQPGVYWWLDAPFVDVIGLYSNAAENPGFISGAIPGQAQKTWLVQTLKTIVKQRADGPRKALIMATHHPPFTAGGHSPSTQMLADLDDACQQAKVMPDLFLAAHAHSYQRYTREVTFNGKALQIPYLVAGMGGINDQAIKPASGQKTGDHVFEKSLQGYGYLLIQVDGDAHGKASTIVSTMYQVEPKTRKKSRFDRVTVDVGNGTVQ